MKTLLRFKLIYILFLSGQFCIASTKDSINSYLKNINDTSQISFILNHAKKIGKSNIDSALKLFTFAENASKSIGENEFILRSGFEHASFLYFQGRYSEALPKFIQAHEKSLSTQNQKYLYASKIYIGTIHMMLSNYNTATLYMIESLKYFENRNDYFSIAGIYLNLTYIQIEQEDIEKAREYAFMAYDYANKSTNKIYICKALTNIGEIYFLKGKYTTALSYYKKSLEIAETLTSSDIRPLIWLNMGAAYTKLNRMDSALYYTNKIVKKNVRDDMTPIVLPKAYLQFSDIYLLKNNSEKAFDYAKKAFIISDSVKKFELKSLCSDRLSELYARQLDFKKAYEYKLLATSINDSIFTAQKYRFQNEMEAIYENSKKQKEIDLLSKDYEISTIKNKKFKLIVWLAGFIVLLSSLITIMLIRLHKNRSFQEKLEVEQKLLRVQMNPHFIFNSIAAIQNYILCNNALEASAYLADFSNLMRAILTNSNENFITLNQEINTVQTYLKLQHLRIPDKFEYKIDIIEDISTDDFKVPPMLLQPFIENSIEHGILKKKDGFGIICIRYCFIDDFLCMECEDNGIGRDQALMLKSSHHNSMATAITERRIKLLSKYYKEKILFSVIDLVDNENNPSGTKVRFLLPTLYQPEFNKVK